MPKNKKSIWVLIVILIIAMASMLVVLKLKNRYLIWQSAKEQATILPPAQDLPQQSEEPATPEEPEEPTSVAPNTPIAPIASSINYNVPFTSQAPFGVWDVKHKDYCEEASIVMAGRFFAGLPITDPADADAEMVKLDNWQMENFGYFESTTAEETAQMARANYPDLEFEVKSFSVDAMKAELSAGKLVILPLAGRELGNPHFTAPGPIYHMLLVKGYLADGRIITHEPGTRHGENYIYSADVIANAVADYDHATGRVDKSHKLMIVVSKK